MNIDPQIVHAMEELSPFNKLLGIKLIEADGGISKCRIDFREELIGNYMERILHGGVTATLIDMAGGVAVASSFGFEFQKRGMGTVDLRVDYLQPGRGEYFIVRGEVVRPGRMLASTRMEMHNDEGTLIAIGTGIYRVSMSSEPKPMNV